MARFGLVKFRFGSELVSVQNLQFARNIRSESKSRFEGTPRCYSCGVSNSKNSKPSKALAEWKRGVAGAVTAPVQVIDLFSGCGGMSLGFAATGFQLGEFRLLGAVDVNARSLQTYEHNFGVPGLLYDVRDLASSNSLLEEMLGRLDSYDPRVPLVLIGCAPCQGFSAYRKKNWDKVDSRNNLIEAFAEVAASLSPACIVMENVPEMLSGRYWHYFESFRDRVFAEGYFTKQSIHNAAEYGTPQERFRAVVLAMKTESIQLPKPVLKRGEFRTVRDAIGDLEPVQAGETSKRDRFHKSAGHRKSTLDVIRSVRIDGGSRPSGVGPVCLDNVAGFSDVYGRLSWSKPAITITHYARNPASGRFIHPEQDRGLTMREAARLQGFPDRFEFTGTFDDVFRQIGEAVPPPMALAIAQSVAASLRGDGSDLTDETLVHEPVNDSFAGVIAGIKGRR